MIVRKLGEWKPCKEGRRLYYAYVDAMEEAEEHPEAEQKAEKAWQKFIEHRGKCNDCKYI